MVIRMSWKVRNMTFLYILIFGVVFQLQTWSGGQSKPMKFQETPETPYLSKIAPGIKHSTFSEVRFHHRNGLLSRNGVRLHFGTEAGALSSWCVESFSLSNYAIKAWSINFWYIYVNIFRYVHTWYTIWRYIICVYSYINMMWYDVYIHRMYNTLSISTWFAPSWSESSQPFCFSSLQDHYPAGNAKPVSGWDPVQDSEKWPREGSSWWNSISQIYRMYISVCIYTYIYIHIHLKFSIDIQNCHNWKDIFFFPIHHVRYLCRILSVYFL